MKSTRCAAALAAAALLALAACGGGGGSQPVIQVDPPPRTEPETPRVSEEPRLPLQRIEDAVQAPIVEADGTTFVGLNIAPTSGDRWRNDGTVRGIDMHRVRGSFIDVEELKRYLRHDYARDGVPSPYIQRFIETPPTIHLRSGTNEELTSVAVRAVQIINAALPSNWQISVSPAHISVDAAGLPPRGAILVEFGARETWTDHEPIPVSSNIVGSANRLVTAENQIAVGRVWIDDKRSPDDFILTAMVHEILHVLGRQHPQPGLFPDTLMNESGEGVEGHELHPLDREALNAIYSAPLSQHYALSLLATAEEFFATDLGYWLDSTVHVLGRFSVPGGTASFGTAIGVAGHRAWAFGPTPATALTDNRAISGTARWGGMMAGISSDPLDPQTIGAVADLSVDLADLDGRLDFTQMRYLRDTSIIWGDGDLGYSIEVRGNTFVQTGGDAGIVTGAFFGTSHEGMGGSLERSDLTAAFGGKR